MSAAKLSKPQFQAASYELLIKGGACLLTIRGRKLQPPSQRITLQQQNLKINSAKISRLDKKGVRDYQISRINHLASFQQARIHTAEIMYPGEYQLTVEYELVPEKAARLKASKTDLPGSDLMPRLYGPVPGESSVFKLT